MVKWSMRLSFMVQSCMDSEPSLSPLVVHNAKTFNLRHAIATAYSFPDDSNDPSTAALPACDRGRRLLHTRSRAVARCPTVAVATDQEPREGTRRPTVGTLAQRGST